MTFHCVRCHSIHVDGTNVAGTVHQPCPLCDARAAGERGMTAVDLSCSTDSCRSTLRVCAVGDRATAEDVAVGLAEWRHTLGGLVCRGCAREAVPA